MMSSSIDDIKLTDSQENIYKLLQQSANEEPLPENLPIYDPCSDNNNSLTNNLILPDSGLEVLNKNLENENVKLKTTRDFYSWFTKLEPVISQVELEEANNYLEQLKIYQKQYRIYH